MIYQIQRWWCLRYVVTIFIHRNEIPGHKIELHQSIHERSTTIWCHNSLCEWYIIHMMYIHGPYIHVTHMYTCCCKVRAVCFTCSSSSSSSSSTAVVAAAVSWVTAVTNCCNSFICIIRTYISYNVQTMVWLDYFIISSFALSLLRSLCLSLTLYFIN